MSSVMSHTADAHEYPFLKRNCFAGSILCTERCGPISSSIFFKTRAKARSMLIDLRCFNSVGHWTLDIGIIFACFVKYMRNKRDYKWVTYTLFLSLLSPVMPYETGASTSRLFTGSCMRLWRRRDLYEGNSVLHSSQMWGLFPMEIVSPSDLWAWKI